MIKFKLLFIFLTLCLLSVDLITEAAKKPCQVYTVNYTCEGVPVKPPDANTSCGEYLIETTLKLMKEGYDVITKQFQEIKDNKEAVLMIGKTGTGKSTLTFFIAGNDSLMFAYKSSTENYGIKDCNGKIGESTIVSKTTFPELVIESKNNTAFFDYPGFMDTRPVCAEISNAYFMLAVATQLARAKLVFVIDHDSVITGQSKGPYTDLLKSILNFIPGIENFKKGFSLVATKVPGTKADSLHIKDVVAFLEASLPDLGLVFENKDDLRKAKFITQQLLKPNRIGVFRQPDKCGPLNSIAFLQTNKQNLNSVINEINYINTYPEYFSMGLTPTAQVEIIKLKLKLNVDIENAFRDLAGIVYDYITSELDCGNSKNCDHVVNVVQSLYEDTYFGNGYKDSELWDGLTFTEIINQTTTVYTVTNMGISENVTMTLLSYADYIDVLNSYDNVTLTNPLQWFEPLREMKRKLAADVINLNGLLGASIESTITEIFSSLYLNLFPEILCIDKKCETLMINLEHLYSNLDFRNLYEYPGTWISLTYTETVKRLTGYEFENYIIDPSAILSLEVLSKNLQDLQSAVNGSKLSIESWLKSPRELKQNVTESTKELYTILVHSVEQGLWELSQEILAYLSVQFNCKDETACLQIITVTENIFADQDFKAGYENYDASSTGLNAIINRATNIFYTFPEIAILKSNATILDMYSKYIDSLRPFEEFSLDIDDIFEPMKDIKVTVLSGLVNLNLNFDKTIKDSLKLFTDFLIRNLITGTELNCAAVDNVTFQRKNPVNKSTTIAQLNDLNILYSNTDFNQSYVYPGTWVGLTFKGIITRLIDLKFNEFDIEEALIGRLQSYSKYLDRLRELVKTLEINIDAWLQIMRSFKMSISSAVGTELKAFVYKCVAEATNAVYQLIFINQVVDFNKNNDVFAVLLNITTIEQSIIAYRSDIEAEYFLDGGLVAGRFVKKTIQHFKTLDNQIRDDEFYSHFDPTLYFEFFEKFGISTKVKQDELVTWFQPLTHFELLIGDENKWYDFLVDLLSDLSHKNTQTDGVWKFKDWWVENGAIQSDDNYAKLRMFWSSFESVPAIAKLHVSDAIGLLTASRDRQSKFDSLNILLQTTLTAEMTCIDANRIRDCSGLFVSLQSVLSYQGLLADSEVESLVIRAYHSVYLDAHLIGSRFNNGSNVDVYIISPTWITTGFQINLAGAPGFSEIPIEGVGGEKGKPGGVGGNAGNLYGIGRYYPVSVPDINVTGGQGGNGQNGQAGSIGLSGEIKMPWYTTENGIHVIIRQHCNVISERASFDFQFYPYNCSSDYNYAVQKHIKGQTPECTLKSKRATFNIFGTRCTSGGRGGDGGQAGRGGFGGKVFIKGVEDNQSWDHVGISGALGLIGIGAFGGTGGIDGPTHSVKITDCRVHDCYTKNPCQVISRHNSSGYVCKEGLKGWNGQISPILPKEHEFNYRNAVPLYIAQFITETKDLKTNKFLKTPLTEFIAKIKNLALNP